MRMLECFENRTVLPLVGTSYEPGFVEEAIQKMEDVELAEIARAEKYFFSANAEECVKIVEKYLSSEDMMLRLSADMLYVFSNLTLGNEAAVRHARTDVDRCVEDVFKKDMSNEVKASVIFASYLTSIFLHIPPRKDIPSLQEYMYYLPKGQRLFAISLLAHAMYLNGEYEKAEGAINGAKLLADQIYPISLIYLNCVAAMCQINQKKQDEAIETISYTWEMAKKDKFLEPFIEYHGLLQGILEVYVRKSEPDIYDKLVDGVLAFSRGWMKIHNPQTQKMVTDLLTPLEFSIAMLACRDWTNQEISNYMGMSVNTIKHHVSNILEKLNIEKRSQIKDFVNQ